MKYCFPNYVKIQQFEVYLLGLMAHVTHIARTQHSHKSYLSHKRRLAGGADGARKRRP